MKTMESAGKTTEEIKAKWGSVTSQRLPVAPQVHYVQSRESRIHVIVVRNWVTYFSAVVSKIPAVSRVRKSARGRGMSLTSTEIRRRPPTTTPRDKEAV